MLDTQIIKKFVNEEIDENEFKENVKEVIASLNELINKYGAKSEKEYDKNGMLIGEITASDYISSAITDLDALKLIEEEEEELKKLPTEAAICDMCNNFAHASRLIKYDTKRITSSMFSLKNDMIEQIIKECDIQGNKCYGKGYDSIKDCETFIVDIPMYGQISWHLGGRTVSCKQYDFEKDKTDYRNCDFLNRNIKYSDIKRLPTHTQKVLFAMDNEEMVESLYGEVNPAKVKNSDAPII